MKKLTLLVVFVFCAVVSFSLTVNAEGKKNCIDVKPILQKTALDDAKIDAVKEQQQRDRYFRVKKRKDERWKRVSLNSGMQRISSSNSTYLDVDTSTTYWREDSSGDLIYSGECYNAGASSAMYIELSIEVYDADDNYLGSDSGWVFGGTNSKDANGEFWNALRPNEIGFFKIWTDISYADASYILYRLTYTDIVHSPAMARVEFDGPVYFNDFSSALWVEGYLKNTGSTYVTYDTLVSMAVYDMSDKHVVDVDYDYIDGSTYGEYSGALYPGDSSGFSIWFYDALYSEVADTYRAGFEWGEAILSTLTEKDPPFGTFDTPAAGSTVASSVAVTGWALDDSGVESVKIYLNQGGNQIFLGDANFVEGARPDVAAAFPEYPNNSKAGWGYMMLTNFLPGGGNGTYELQVVATDTVGKTAILGSKTIIVDNVNAELPFGAIDTPEQGGIATGSNFINWGWVLTPQPNSIPTDGSTINAYVDGVNVGNVTYNIYREDIANYFPDYANSNGAAGYISLDTTRYSNGVHIIQWTATDSGRNTDGIGSRFFSVSNANRTKKRAAITGTKTGAQAARVSNITELNRIPVNRSMPIRLKRGYRNSNNDTPHEAQMQEPADNRIVIKPQERIVLNLTGNTENNGSFRGYHVINGKLMPLPLGSTLNNETGTFYWIPPIAFQGRHQLVFIETAPDGTETKQNIFVNIIPNTK
jgi:hypothetical protein